MKKIALTGSWNLRSKDEKVSITGASLPGDNYSALFSAGIIPDPYYSDNEKHVQWVGRTDWIYERQFNVPPAVLREDSVFLNIEGLDTQAEILINGARVGSGRNMFRRYRFEIKPFLKPGANTIQIEIRSPEKAAASLARKLTYPIPHNLFPVQSMHRNLLRKTQCHGGWDWGPCLMVSGVYGAVWIGATSQGRIEYVYTEQRHGKDSCEIEVTCEITATRPLDTRYSVEIAGRRKEKRVGLKPGLNLLTLSMRVQDPILWWPNGYGAQHLYPLLVEVAGDKVEKHLGLRRLEVSAAEDKDGLSMTFVVNGTPIFCKGANWIPADALPQRQTPQVLRKLLAAAAEVNMNMIRLWGGGQFESDEFYELCDRLGLLVWHDFMFSCALYPSTREFLDNVNEEVRHQVKRLRDHPSIALWCGNNEIVGALTWYEESRRNRDRYLVDYDRLTEGTVGRAVDACDPTRLFWPSSPCGGRNNYSDCWHDDSRGDMHYWSVWHEGKPFEAYYDVRPRFCSEFGYQSFPSLQTVRAYAPKGHWNPTSPSMEWHQRNPGGNSRIIEMFSRYFRMPETFEHFLYLSQVQQAIAIKTGVEYWRSLRPVCMGALYWQLNDNWPVCSWSSLEYGGRWKLLHYMARRFYAPILVSAFKRGEGIDVYAVNDLGAAQDFSLSIRCLDFDGKKVRSVRKEGRLPPASSVLLGRYSAGELTKEPDRNFLLFDMKTKGGHLRNELFFNPYKHCEMGRAKVRCKVESKKEGVGVTLTTDRPAFFVSLDQGPLQGTFSDNCFTLVPGDERKVIFRPEKPADLRRLEKFLRVYTLSDWGY